MVDKMTIRLLGWQAAREAQPSDGPPYPCTPEARELWREGYAIYRDGKELRICAVTRWRGTR